MSPSALFDSLPHALTPASYSSYSILTVLGVALLARVWMMISPADVLENEPVYLPYAIPWLGHTVPFIRNTHHFLTKATNRMHLRPFTIKVAGAKKYILTHPREVQQLFKATNLTFYSFAADHLKEVYDIHDSDDCTLLEFFEGGKKLRDGSVTDGVHGWFRQTLSGTHLDSMTQKTTHSMELACEKTVTELPVDGQGSIGVELFSWVYDVIGHAVIAASFGETFLKVNPNFMPLLLEFDGVLTKLLLRIPKPFARRAYESREELVQMLMGYVADDEQGRQMRAESSPYACGRLEALKAAGFDSDTRARWTLPMIQAAFVTNTLPAILWMIILISVTPGLLEKVDAETQPAFTSGGLDTDYLNAQASCPLLNSIFYEMLRFCSATVVSRGVEESITIGEYTLHKGVDIICPARTMQLSEEIWGKDAAKFDPYRFVDRPQEATGQNMRVFGGGYFMCPGRHFATVMIKSAVALAITHFKFEIPGGVPVMDESMPPLGTLKPLHGVKAFISRRK